MKKAVSYLCKARPADVHNQCFWDLEQARFADKPEPQPGNKALHQELRSNSKKIAQSDIFVRQKLERDRTNI